MTAGPPSRYASGERAGVATGISQRSRGVAFGLAVVGGVFGLHRFYVGRAHSGVWMCLTLGGLGIWYLYDVVVIAAGEFHDADGCRVARWEVADWSGGPPPPQRRGHDLEGRLQALQSPGSEPAQRLGFAERLLGQGRGTGA